MAVSVAVADEESSPWSFSGDAKYYYTTTDDRNVDLFSQESASGQASISGNAIYAFADPWQMNVGVTAISTLGLDDHMVSDVWLYAGSNATDDPNGSTSFGDAAWFDVANITGEAFDGKMTFLLGRIELDTPLIYTETWNIANNTFDAVSLTVDAIEKLTLIADYIYDGNGNGNRLTTMGGGFTGGDGYFPFLGSSDGALAIGAINTLDEVTSQAWYFDISDEVKAFWLQADGNYNSFTIGAQYAMINSEGHLGLQNSAAFSIKLGYSKEIFSFWTAYSTVAKDGMISISNTATMMKGIGWGDAPGSFNVSSGESKLYTEASWNLGYVGLPGADTFAIGGNYNLREKVDFTAKFVAVKNGLNTFEHSQEEVPLVSSDMNEFSLFAETSLYGFDLTASYIWAHYTINHINQLDVDLSNQNNTLQLYITYVF